MPSRSRSKSSNKSSHKHGGNSTSDQFGFWAIIVRVILAILTVILIILLIVYLFECITRNNCRIDDWLINIICILILCYGLWGIFAEAFWAIITLALNTFIWAILAFVLSFNIVAGLLALFICFVACVYAYMIFNSGIDNNPLGCCCCC